MINAKTAKLISKSVPPVENPFLKYDCCKKFINDIESKIKKRAAQGDNHCHIDLNPDDFHESDGMTKILIDECIRYIKDSGYKVIGYPLINPKTILISW